MSPAHWTPQSRGLFVTWPTCAAWQPGHSAAAWRYCSLLISASMLTASTASRQAKLLRYMIQRFRTSLSVVKFERPHRRGGWVPVLIDRLVDRDRRTATVSRKNPRIGSGLMTCSVCSIRVWVRFIERLAKVNKLCSCLCFMCGFSTFHPINTWLPSIHRLVRPVCRVLSGCCDVLDSLLETRSTTLSPSLWRLISWNRTLINQILYMNINNI